eukprot:m.42570 g.42570  ORF g.42570 m.42570 type:complete len:166 (-) comp8337_c0_seq1:39-536(-)
MGPCTLGAGDTSPCPTVQYPLEGPLLFNVCIDPSEGIPLAGADNGTVKNGARFNGSNPGPSPIPVAQDEIDAAYAAIVAAVKVDLATFTAGTLIMPPGRGRPRGPGLLRQGPLQAPAGQLQLASRTLEATERTAMLNTAKHSSPGTRSGLGIVGEKAWVGALRKK